MLHIRIYINELTCTRGTVPFIVKKSVRVTWWRTCQRADSPTKFFSVIEGYFQPRVPNSISYRYSPFRILGYVFLLGPLFLHGDLSRSYLSGQRWSRRGRRKGPNLEAGEGQKNHLPQRQQVMTASSSSQIPTKIQNRRNSQQKPKADRQVSMGLRSLGRDRSAQTSRN